MTDPFPKSGSEARRLAHVNPNKLSADYIELRRLYNEVLEETKRYRKALVWIRDFNPVTSPNRVICLTPLENCQQMAKEALEDPR